MRSLAKPMKNKQHQKKEGEKKESKPTSKKVVKTVFNSPFRYKMYIVAEVDSRFHWRMEMKLTPF